MGLNLPNVSVRAMTEDELKTAKDVLAARASSAGRASPEKVASQIAIAAGEWVPAFHLSLQAFMEIRSPKLEAVTRPYAEGMQVPPVPQIVQEPFDVWSVAAPPRPAGAPAKDFILIPATLQMKDCQACLGKSSVPCKVCFAKGTLNCDICMGAGSQPCGICKGTSKISCPDCNGSGKVRMGSASTPCGSCNGIGKFDCSRCVEGKVDCPGCGNGGKKPCHACGGAGKQSCAGCAGSAKVVFGKGFQTEFRPQQAQATLLAVEGPQPAQDMALSRKSAAAVFDFASEEAFSKELAAADVPESFRSGLQQLLSRVKPSASVRLGAVKLSVSQGEVWRVTGSFSGHEFIYWIHPSTRVVVSERDPLGEVSRQTVEVAQSALKRGDWESAVDAARETLSLDPNHPEAKSIAANWRQRLFREAFLAGAAAGTIGALLSVAVVFGAEKGLYRLGPAIYSVALSMAVGWAAAFAALPVLRRVFPFKKRMLTGLGVAGAAVFLFFGGVWGMGGWNPVKTADQKALDRELASNFQFGVSAVYQPNDLIVLQGLYEKYKNSRANLNTLNEYLQTQISLKVKNEVMTREFKEKMDEVRSSKMFLPQKREKVAELKSYYALRGVDTVDADAFLKELDEQIDRAAKALPSTRRPAGTISITPLRRAAPARKAAPAPVKRAPVKGTPAPRKVAPAKKKAAPVKKRVGVTPLKETETKKKGIFGSSKTVD